MKNSTVFTILLSLFLAFILQTFGFILSIHKPLWRDEINTQTYTINESYADILLGKDKAEGNVAPLFYIQQKIFCDICHFHTPLPWLQGNWKYEDMLANIFLRILPVAWMSSFFILLFFYFSFRFNIFFGSLSLLTAFSSPALWLYWAEARPYGLWVLLTALQMILFLEILHDKKPSDRKWIGLSCVNVLLSLNCILSFFQITIVCAMLLFKERRWHRYIFAFALPMLLIHFYQPQAPSSDLIFIITVPQIIFSIVPLNQALILLFYPLLLRIYSLQNQKLILKTFHDDIFTVSPFFSSIFLMFIAMVIFLTVLHAHATGRGQFVTQRHVLFLIPVTVIGISYLSGLLWKILRPYFWLRISTILLIIGLLLFHADTTWGKIYFLCTHNIFS